MVKSYTTLLFVLASVPAIQAQAQAGPPLGSEFIFFRNGTNLTLPHAAGFMETDPQNPTQARIRYDYGNWSYQSFGWDPAVGVDMTANHAAGNILHLQLMVDPGNRNQANTFIMFEDKTNGQSDDLPMRLVWKIPETMKDGNWHTLDIPLPPQKCEDLAAARGTLGTGDHWYYGGSWSDATQRVGGYDDACANTTEKPEYWKEFEWTNVKSLGIFWDHNAGGGSIWLDDVYIGPQGLDLTVADTAPNPLSSITVDMSSEGNKVSWSHDPQSRVAAYRVYALGLGPISSDLLAIGFMPPLVQISASASDFSILHHAHLIHPDLFFLDIFPPDISYAVTPVSEFGVENFDVNQTATVVSNVQLPIAPIISELTATEVINLENDLAAGNASNEAFHDGWQTFRLNQERFQVADVPTPPNDDQDLSGTFYLGYSSENDLYFYAEVLDSDIELPPSEDPGNAPWEYDVIELGWSNYSLIGDTVSGIPVGDPLVGPWHQSMERGIYADYHMRIGGKGDGSEAFVWVEPGVGGIPPGSQAVYNEMTDAQGNATGYKILARIPLDAIQGTGDAIVDPPLGYNNVSRAINIVLGDRDSGVRESQIQWSLKPTANGQWWHTPSQWEPIGMIGRDSYRVATESEVPSGFSLDQNYPNPFNPQTSIRFTLPMTERVTLTVHDLLGRTVATLLHNESLGAGSHTVPFNGQGLASGMYIYRIQAGATYTASHRMMLIK